jgi:hypothetical protein
MKNNKQQPMSIDFLLDEFIKNGVYLSPYFLQKFREAKAMHKEEHKSTYIEGFTDGMPKFEKYYNETFGGKNEQQ